MVPSWALEPCARPEWVGPSRLAQSVLGPRFRGGLGDKPSRALIAYTVERAIARARQVSTRPYRRPAEGEMVWLTASTSRRSAIEVYRRPVG